MSSKTIHVGRYPIADTGGLDKDVTEEMLHNGFVTFGEISDIQLPKIGEGSTANRGFGFITFSEKEEAEDAIDNMHLNEFRGSLVTVNMAKAQKVQAGDPWRPIWETEEWIKEYGTQGQTEGAMQG